MIHIQPWETFFGGKVTPSDMGDVQWLKGRLKGESVSHTNNALSMLSTVLDFAGGLKLIPRRDFKVKLLKMPRSEMAFYDFDEFERLVEAAGKEDPRILAVVLLGGEAGLRRGEMLGLTQARVRFDRNVIVVASAVSKNVHTTTKTGNVREVLMTDRLRAVLKDVQHLRGDLLLYRDDGEPATGRVLQRWIERAERRARMDVTGRIHILRHTFCSHLAMQGVPVRTIQQLAGHANITTTMRYMHLSPEAREEGIRALARRRSGVGGSGANREPIGSQLLSMKKPPDFSGG
jgi:integrase